jgi:predicted ATPase/Tfp pilus assembly protein PilF
VSFGGRGEDAPQIFISHSSQDGAAAAAAVAVLEAAGVRCWVAPRDIAPGEEWSAAIVRALRSCRALMLLYSAASNDSPQVLREVERAVSLRLPLVTLKLEGAPLSPAMEYFISVAHWVAADDGAPLSSHLPALAEQVRGLLARTPDPRTAARPAATGPSPAHTSAIPPSGPRTNLPAATTRFIGREAERAQVAALLTGGGARLVTLTGVGGGGKTRLAVEAARPFAEDPQTTPFPDGVFLAELAPLADPALVAGAVAAAAGVREEPGRPAEETLANALRDRRTLLLLDNCEHVVAAAARLASSLLKSCPHLRVLATSREPLGVAGENVVRVAGLSVPPPDDGAGPEALLEASEAARLFADRAALVRPGFAVTAENAGAVARLCRRLDGIPLAVELAAARVRALAPEQIDARLSDRFRLLGGGDRSALPRQQTLRAAIDWSHDLLGEGERAALRRLSVFSGGWTLEAAEAVLPDGDLVQDWEVLDLLTALVDKSLVAPPAGDRYRLLETVHEYAREKLDAAGPEESAETAARHRTFFRDLVQAAETDLRTVRTPALLARLEADHDNLRAVLDRCAAAGTPGALADALAITGALWRFWEVRGHNREARERLAALLGAADALGGAVGPERTGRSRMGAGNLARSVGDFAAAQGLLERAYEEARAAGDPALESSALGNLGTVALFRGDQAGARDAYRRAIEAAVAAGDRAVEAAHRSNLSVAYYHAGDYAAAHEECERSLALHTALNNRAGMAANRSNLGHVAMWQGQYAVARGHYEAALGLYREIGDPAQEAVSLNNVGMTVSGAGDPVAARALFEQALEIHRRLGDRTGEATALTNIAAAAADSADFDRAEEAGRAGLAILEEIGHRIGEAATLNTLARIALERGDPEAARPVIERSLPMQREVGYRAGEAEALNSLGRVTLATGDADGARALFEQALAIRRELGDNGGLTDSLGRLGDLALDTGDPTAALAHYRDALTPGRALGRASITADLLARVAAALAAADGTEQSARTAARLLGAAARVREGSTETHAARSGEAERQAAQETAVRALLGANAYEAEFAAGRLLSDGEAVALAVGNEV